MVWMAAVTGWAGHSAFVDLPFRQDLRRCDGVTFKLTVDDVHKYGSFSCYFKSGDGWYRTGFTVGESGESVITVNKDKIDIEGTPAGWQAVEAMRVRGYFIGEHTDGELKIAEPRAVGLDPEALVLQWPQDSAYAGAMQLGLRELRVRSAVIAEGDLDEAMLAGVKAVFLPYNPKLSREAQALVTAFVKRGGRVFVAYAAPSAMAALAGVKVIGGVRRATGGDLIGFQRAGAGLKGQPQFCAQPSWATMTVEPMVGSEVVATWKGETTTPAIVRGANGVYMSHVWFGINDTDGADLLAAMVAELLPESAERVREARRAAARREAQDRAWVAAQPTGDADEFRAFWCHSANGLGRGKSWDESIAFLKENGFNTMIANLAWGHFTYDREYDECLAACRKHGVKLHVWCVCWNLGGRLSEAEIQSLRAEGRLMVDKGGKEHGEKWLCPTDPRNLALQIETFVKMAKKGADGVHFDYVRYADGNTCYCDGCLRRFKEKYGATPEAAPEKWLQFRREAIDALVKGVVRRVRAEAPGVEISAAVFKDFTNARESVGQDWTKWCREGLLDFICPMDYMPTTAAFETIVTSQLPVIGQTRIYPGIGLSSTHAPKGGRLRRVAEQIVACRRLGLKGFTVFNFDTSAQAILPSLAKGPTAPIPNQSNNGK